LSGVRVIPVLTIDNNKLVKTVKFKKPNYIGDPINAVKIFNEKEVDEIVLLDITATKEDREPSYSKIEEICSEAFMPFAYGGGITNMSQIDKLFQLGIEKVILNSVLDQNDQLVKEATKKFGSQSIVGSIDVKKSIFGKYQVFTKSGSQKAKLGLTDYLKKILDYGIGELILNSIDNEGTYLDYDFKLVKLVSNITKIPLVVCGGANSLESFKLAIESGASAVAAGSLFVYRGRTNGILINYPTQEEINRIIFA